MPRTSVATRTTITSLLVLFAITLFYLASALLTRGFASGYLPHGYPYVWDEQLLGFHVAADGVTFLSYLAIAAVFCWIAYRNHREMRFGWGVVALGIFAISCGLTHLMNIVVLWQPFHWMALDMKILTAIASAMTACVLTSLAPAIGRMLKAAATSKKMLAGAERAHPFTRSIIDSSSFSIIVTDQDGTILAANPASERMLWYSTAELATNRNITSLMQEHEIDNHAEELATDLGQTIPADAQALITLAGMGQVAEGDWTFVRKDGSTLPTRLTVSANFGPDGIDGYIFTAFDNTERLRSQDYLRHVATHDALTGLPSRVLFRDRLDIALARARRYRHAVAVIMIDLDNFKRINDSMGHQAGDDVLVTVAQRLRAGVRIIDTVARMSGDEFVVILSDIREPEVAGTLAQNLLNSLFAPMIVNHQEILVTASMGICIDSPDTDAVSLLKNADVALYRSKTAGKSQISWYTENMEHATIEKLQLESSLRLAIERDELSLQYQPQFSLKTGACTGMEALLRWERRDLGVVEPSDFIPLAEETGLIVSIGNWALQRACADTVRMSAELGVKLTVAVNISPRQFQDKSLYGNIERALSDSGLPSSCLELEITENIPMHAPESLLALGQVRDLGVCISIGDFGTGFSSMSYITRFAIDRLKIARSFVHGVAQDPSSEVVIVAIIAMAHGLGVEVLAEGVETEEQLRFMVQHGCDKAQGYYFSQPMVEAAFIRHYGRHPVPIALGQVAHKLQPAV